MIASIALMLALAGATQDPGQALAQVPDEVEQPAANEAAVQQPAGPVTEEAAAPHVETAEEGHGEGIDYMHHILDEREWATPFGYVHFPEKGSWMVGPIDMTPTKHLLFLVFAAILTLAVLLPAAAMAARAEKGLPKRRRHNAVEALVLFLRDRVVMDNIGHGGERYAPFVLTLFFFILFANLLGLLPWGSTATANIAVTAALAILAFVVIELAGIQAQGVHYLNTIFYWNKELALPLRILLAAIMTPVEIIGKFTKPFSLAIRLMANMTAGHIVLLAIISLIFVFASYFVAIAPVLMGVAIFLLEIFVGFLQAFIFAMLTSVFIGLIRHAH